MRRPERPSDKPSKEEWIKLPQRDRIAVIGHRAYVGGAAPGIWFTLGKRQFHFLVSEGLRPHHRFLDIACGSLRLGQFLIPYLNPGRYYGLEAEPALVEAGLREELFYDVAKIRRPRFGYGYDFNFGFVPGFEFAIAQSLFTHLNAADIALCLRNLADVAGPESTLYFTFFEGSGAEANPEGGSDSHRNWRYSFADIDGIAAAAGWTATYIGDWGHERGQMMVKARL